jgi:hypothetical protein
METLTSKLFGIFDLLRRREVRAEHDLSTNASAVVSPPPFSERRQSPRRWGDPIQVLIWDDNMVHEPARGWIVNRSIGGLGLSAVQPVLEGALLSVRVSIAPQTVPWTHLQVKSCIPSAGRWILGCQFVEPPPQEIRLMFR